MSHDTASAMLLGRICTKLEVILFNWELGWLVFLPMFILISGGAGQDFVPDYPVLLAAGSWPSIAARRANRRGDKIRKKPAAADYGRAVRGPMVFRFPTIDVNGGLYVYRYRKTPK